MKKLTVLMICLLMTIGVFSNNVVISNISLVGSAGNFRVQFDLSWDNGWRVSTGQGNYDGVWVFFKYRIMGGNWQHLYMSGTNNTIYSRYTVYQNNGPGITGAIIHSIDEFTGTTTLTEIELGVNDVSGFNIDIRGFAVEMVYIPQCSNCIIGDGDGVFESTQALHVSNNTSGPLGSTFSADFNFFDDITLRSGLAINAAGIAGNDSFPTGQATWCMKYELSQAAYRDFLNSLTLAQQTTRTENAPTSAVGTAALAPAPGINRNNIEIATPSSGGSPAVYGCDGNNNNVFDEATDGEWIACNYLSWMDMAAWLDWAGLAPMTEIIYERICRGASTLGTNPSIFGEYAWGSTSIFSSAYIVSNVSAANEIISNASSSSGNAIYSVTSEGPARTGIFATASSDRITSGSSFYGVMDMSGNIYESCVTVGNVAGRGFTGLNGDGTLSLSGNANTLNWPCGSDNSSAPSCSEVTDSEGTILRGGHWNDISVDIRVSRRTSDVVHPTREWGQGCRGVLYIY
jgi:hypothetical protein